MSDRKSFFSQYYIPSSVARKGVVNLDKMRSQISRMNLTNAFKFYKLRVFQNYMCSISLIYLIITTVHSAALLSTYKGDGINEKIFIYLGSGSSVFLMITFYLRLSWTRRSLVCAHVLAWMVTVVMSLSDLSNCVYISLIHNRAIRPTYADFVISAVYLFMPILNRLQLLFMSILVTSFYAAGFTNSAIVEDEMGVRKLHYNVVVPDILFLICLNLLGFYVNWQRDIILHSIFLTKRESLEQTIILKYAKDQEKALLVSIIPPTIARKIGQEIKDRIEKDVRGYMLAQIQARKLYIETHQDVSILFADVVNYTFLTTKLEIKDLVETLHELFQRIDSACLEYNVTRIKFLGDCYYGVSGIPVSHPLHAVCCIELGRAIINHIRELRSFRNLDIDMRIGIHSGSILAGIIGASKWQYDIWSEDVNIANRLEATGAAGRIHVSRATLNLSYDFYSYENGPARAKLDNVLQKYFIYTYLIIDRNGNMDSSPEWLRYLQSRVGDNYPINQANVGTILQKEEASAKANKQMSKEINKLPICKINLREHCFMHQRRLCPEEMEEFKAQRCVSAFFLQYNDWQWELIHMNQSLMRFKVEVTIGIFMLVCVITMQFFNLLIRNPLAYSIANVLLLVCGIFVIIVVWFDVIYRKVRLRTTKRSKIRTIRRIHKYLEYALKTAIGRMVVVSSMLLLCLLAAWIPLMLCDYVVLENDDELLSYFLKMGYRTECFNSWAVTEGICLLIGFALSFTMLPYFYLLAVTGGIFLLYAYLILSHLSVVYEGSTVTNIGLDAQFSHIWSILIVLYIYHLSCRHFVYISKYNLYSRWQLNKKVENARVTNQSIEVLLHNILPSYVIQVYLSRQMNNEPYYEKHRFMSIMFATIVHDDMERIDLRLMNEMICDFDDVLSYYKSLSKIEKIKVINWTYMAACGFDVLPGHTESSESMHQRSAFLPNKPRTSSQEHDDGTRTSSVSHNKYRTSFQGNEFRVGKLNIFASDTNLGNESGQSRPTVQHEGRLRQSTAFLSVDELPSSTNNTPQSASEESELENIQNFSSGKLSSDISNRPSTSRSMKIRLSDNNEEETDESKIVTNSAVDEVRNSTAEADDINDTVLIEEDTPVPNELDINKPLEYYDEIDEQMLEPNAETDSRSSRSRRVKRVSTADGQKAVRPVRSDHNVFVCKALVHFALDLLKVVDSINSQLKDKMGSDFMPLKLRIGMSAGEVMAGIVGCRQAHYDIWGNSVNMASRMDTTGVPNEIQVTENVAEILGEHGISCRYRGLTFVKGRGEIPTYFVNISSDREFIPPNT